MRKSFNKIPVYLFIIILLFTTIITASELKVHFLDVGQADSILLQLPNNETMLIDAGNNTDGDMVVNYIRSQGLKKLDYLIGTHPHEDHIGGLDDVIKSLKIGQIYMPNVTHTTKTFEDVLLAVKSKNKKITSAKAGVTIIDEPECQAYFLSPAHDNYEELNYWSAVIKLDYKNTSFLFMGDAEEINEFEILARSSIQPFANVLKVGHHGSHSSTTEPFLTAVNPDYAVISVGQGNNYGHPSPIVLNCLQEHDIKVYRTDKQGTIIATSDGENIQFDTDPIKPKIPSSENTSSVQIIGVDLQDEIVLIKNTGQSSVNISDWKLLSVKGNQEFFFPYGTNILPGETIKIVSGRNAQPGSDVFVWTKAYIWNNNGDPAELYDNMKNLISDHY